MKLDKEENPVVKRFPNWLKGWARPSCGEGWDNILIELFQKVEELLDEQNISRDCFVVGQIKEKFAGLRVYVHLEIEDEKLRKQIYTLISEAEDKADKTCESCGQPGILRDRGWMKTLCDNCNKKSSIYT